MTAPPGEPRFVPAAATGTYMVYMPWANLPIGTVVKRASGRRWEAYTRLGRSVGVRPTRTRATAALAAWTWDSLPAPARRHALKVARVAPGVAA